MAVKMTRDPPMIDPTSGRPDLGDDDLLTDLIKALDGMVSSFRPFTMKPMGDEGSAARTEQHEQIEAHRFARQVLARARGDVDIP